MCAAMAVVVMSPGLCAAANSSTAFTVMLRLSSAERYFAELMLTPNKSEWSLSFMPSHIIVKVRTGQIRATGNRTL